MKQAYDILQVAGPDPVVFVVWVIFDNFDQSTDAVAKSLESFLGAIGKFGDWRVGKISQQCGVGGGSGRLTLLGLDEMDSGEN
jgi:hypothetical protein